MSKHSKTPLAGAIEEVRLDQYMADDILRDFNFELASKLIAIYADVKFADNPERWKPSPEGLRERAAKCVLEALEGGRKLRWLLNTHPRDSRMSTMLDKTYNVDISKSTRQELEELYEWAREHTP